jgi:hypothetical protein
MVSTLLLMKSDAEAPAAVSAYQRRSCLLCGWVAVNRRAAAIFRTQLAATLVIIVIIIAALTSVSHFGRNPSPRRFFSVKCSLSADQFAVLRPRIVWCGMRADGFSRVESLIPAHLSDESCAVECGNVPKFRTRDGEQIQFKDNGDE